MRNILKMLSLALVACMLLSMIPVAAFAEAEQQTYTDKYGTWIYTVDDNGEITIVGYEGTRKNIVVPSDIGGKRVIALGDAVFKGNEHICQVDIPTGILSIGAEVFADCPKLEDVRLPLGLETIGDGAFQNCDKLGILDIPSSVTEIAANAFEGSDNLIIRCESGTYAAEFLEANQDSVNAYEIRDWKEPFPELNVGSADPAPSVGVITEEENNNSSAPVVKPIPSGKTVTYTFGENNEYTLVLIDTNPSMNINRYMKTKNNGWYFDDAEFSNENRNRFYLVSLTQKTANGDKTILDSTMDVEAYFSTGSITIGGETGIYPDSVSYRLNLYSETDSVSNPFPSLIEFDYDINLTKFTFVRRVYQGSTVQNGNTLTHYYLDSIADSEYIANGVHNKNTDGYYKGINRKYTDNHVNVNLSRTKETYTDKTGEMLGDDEFKSVNVTEHNPNMNHGVSAYGSIWQHKDETGNVCHVDGYQVKLDVTYMPDGGTEDVETEYKGVQNDYDENGGLQIQAGSYIPVRDGVYKHEQNYYRKDYTSSGSYTSFWHETDSEGNTVSHEKKTEYDDYYVYDIEYTEEVLRANNVQEAESLIRDHFHNDPDEHYEDITERTVSAELREVDDVYTDLETGEVTTSQYLNKSEKLTDHTYVGETGKYVGWDWRWGYNIDSIQDEGTLTSYAVTEYTYNKDTDTWEKTEVSVIAPYEYDNETGKWIYHVDPDVDFKNVFPEDILDGYNVYYYSYIFDDSDATGSDNWRQVGEISARKDNEENERISVYEEKEEGWWSSTATIKNGELTYGEADVEAVQKDLNHAYDIINGQTTISDGNGNILSQADKKEELLELEAELMNPDYYPTPEELYQEVLDMVPNGEGAELDAELYEESIPESNVDFEEEIEEIVDGAKSLASATDLVY